MEMRAQFILVHCCIPSAENGAWYITGAEQIFVEWMLMCLTSVLAFKPPAIWRWELLISSILHRRKSELGKVKWLVPGHRTKNWWAQADPELVEVVSVDSSEEFGYERKRENQGIGWTWDRDAKKRFLDKEKAAMKKELSSLMNSEKQGWWICCL